MMFVSRDDNTQPLQPAQSVEQGLQAALPIPTEIRFYRSSDAYFCLTNFSAHPIVVDEIYWPTVEHYFQAQKFISSDPDWAEKIRNAASPLAAAGMGQDRRHQVREDWEAVKDDIMRFALGVKLAQNADVRAALLATGEAKLILDSDRNSYWGCGVDGSGSNTFGKILMELRSELLPKNK